MGVVLLVRHGQASWGAADYDVLSDTGREQSRLLGEDLRRRGVEVDRVVSGGLKRQDDTAADAGLGPVVVDERSSEFDHVRMLARVPAPFEGREPSRAEFQAWFEEATDRWTGGRYDDYEESFAAFAGRVEDGLAAAGSNEGCTVVVTSGGPVSWAVASLLGRDLDGAGRTALWRRLNPVCANSGVTRIVSGRRGLTFVGFNEHTHLPPGLVTYR